MSGIQLNSITAAGNAAANSVVSSLIPKRQTSHAAAPGNGGLRANATTGTAAPATTSTATGSQTITSTDFLTLLVSELKNQDPTQPTDPNAYITQLAQVNSLQQLININTGITTLDGIVAPATTTTPAALDVHAT